MVSWTLDAVLAMMPLLPPLVVLIQLGMQDNNNNNNNDNTTNTNLLMQLWAYVVMGILAHVATFQLVPHIQLYTLKRGISGKDLGKRGTALEDKNVPEALGIVPGAVFLTCIILCLVGFATWHPAKLLDVNSALLSICFMLFLGFTDDVLEWPWRYKLILPTVASLPLLCCYTGSTSIVVPIPFRGWLWNNDNDDEDGHFTWAAWFLGQVGAVADAQGSLLHLGMWYLLYMGLLAVFCTNAINIYAGINGLEAGQAHVIGSAVLWHNLLEMPHENSIFSFFLVSVFLGVTLGLLRHNWYPASVFVGDTYCYFAGMTFAVVGILGHFSKTLLLFFLPQIFNFLWSLPQLLHWIPCPRHRLPRFNAATGCMEPSSFPCGADDYQWLCGKQTRVVNMTLINLVLQWCGPLTEKTLCCVLLALQMASCALGLYIRYCLAPYFF